MKSLGCAASMAPAPIPFLPIRGCVIEPDLWVVSPGPPPHVLAPLFWYGGMISAAGGVSGLAAVASGDNGWLPRMTCELISGLARNARRGSSYPAIGAPRRGGPTLLGSPPAPSQGTSAGYCGGQHHLRAKTADHGGPWEARVGLSLRRAKGGTARTRRCLARGSPPRCRPVCPGGADRSAAVSLQSVCRSTSSTFPSRPMPKCSWRGWKKIWAAARLDCRRPS